MTTGQSIRREEGGVPFLSIRRGEGGVPLVCIVQKVYMRLLNHKRRSETGNCTSGENSTGVNDIRPVAD